MDQIELYKETRRLVRLLHRKNSYIWIDDLVHDVYLKFLEDPSKLRYFATMCKYAPIDLKKYKYGLLKKDGSFRFEQLPEWFDLPDMELGGLSKISGVGGYDDFSIKALEKGRNKPILVTYIDGSEQKFRNVASFAASTGVSRGIIYRTIKSGLKGRYNGRKLSVVDKIVYIETL